MTKFVRFDVVNKAPVELEVNNASEIDALDGRQSQSMHDALDRFLNIIPFEDQEFFERAVESGVVHFYIPTSGSVSLPMIISKVEQ